MKSTSLLEVRHLHLGYGAHVAVEECSFTVAAGECVGLVGANGSGKSTTLRAIARIHPVRSGTVMFDGHDIIDWSSARAVAEGLVLCPEGRHLFAEMSVEDNILLGLVRARLGRAETRGRLAEIFELFPKLADRRTQLAGTLSGGEQQMVALGRALASQPRLLILDEPTLGLAPMMVEQVFSIVSQVISSGTSVLIAEQNVTATLEAAHRVYVMEAGLITHSGPSAELRGDPQLTAALMGI
jgi:branched-chain amino acid transport system ATP-binding protein